MNQEFTGKDKNKNVSLSEMLVEFFLDKRSSETEDVVNKNRVLISEEVRSIKNKTFKDCLFLRVSMMEVTLNKCEFFNCKFVGCRFNDVEFHKCRFINCEFIKPRFEKTYLDPKYIIFTGDVWRWEKSNINTTLFQRLESNFKHMHQDDFIATAHIKFRRYKRWQNFYRLRESKKKTEKISYFFYILGDFLYETTMLYGYSLFRALGTTIVLIGMVFWVVDMFWISSGFKSGNLDLLH
ncbi:MAG: hypothetical protein ACRCU9_05020, partial [Iodobacter sp.]